MKFSETELQNFFAVLLAKAFHGELVPQDPNDEPAEKLLGRIKASRSATKSVSGRAAKSKKRVPC